MIEVLASTRATPDGSRFFVYEVGRSYGTDTTPPTSPDLESMAIAQGWARSLAPVPVIEKEPDLEELSPPDDLVLPAPEAPPVIETEAPPEKKKARGKS